MDYLVETHNLTKIYKTGRVVDKVNMHIASGEVYGFIGENGAGKTTIIRMITGLVNPSGGGYSVFGLDRKDPKLAGLRSKIAAVVESPSIYQNFSAFDNLLFQCRLLGIKDTGIIDKVLMMVGLSYLRNEKKPAGKFSLGMRQRLGIAMALVGQPRLIILDEPMNGLDPEGIVEIRELILKLNRENGITFLISSHILDELQKMATTFGFIHKGRLVREISARELSEECKKSLDIFVDEPEKVAELCSDGLHISDIKIIDKAVRIFDEISINRLVTFLDSHGIMINKINNNEENVEDYYLEMVRQFKVVNDANAQI